MLPDYYNNQTHYLHFKGENAQTDIAWAYQRIAQAKQRTMFGAKASMRNRQQNAFSALSLTQASHQEINNFLDGTYFSTMQSISEQNLDSGQNGNFNIAQAQVELNNLYQHLDSMQSFANQIQRIFDTLYTDQNTKQLLQSYAQTLVIDAANNKGIMKLGGTKGSVSNKVANGIMRSILNQQNQKFFKLKDGKGNPIADTNAALAKILVLINSLPNVTAKSSKTRTSKQTLNKSKTIKGTDKILQTLADKVYGFFKESFQIAREASLAASFNMANYAGFNAIKNSVDISRMGDLKSVHSWKPDPQLEQDMRVAELEIEQYTKRNSKSDVGFSFNGNITTANGSFTTQAGFTIKDSKNLNFTQANGVQTVSGNITLQEGTSLLVALGREAGFSTNERRRIMQLAVAQSDNATEYDNVWNELMIYIGDRMFLTALAGIPNSSKSAMFAVWNNKIFTVEDLLSSYIDSKDSYISFNDLHGGDGLYRSTYVKMNKWEGPSEARNLHFARQRSEKLYGKVLEKWGATKLRISLNMASMKVFQKN